MLKVKLSMGPNDPVIRQTPGRTGLWKDVQFTLADDDRRCDYWVVFDGIPRPQRVRCDSGHVTFIPAEPPGLRVYNKRFLDQFSSVLTFRTDIVHRHRVRSHPMMPWWAGIRGGHKRKTMALDYDQLRAAAPEDKTDAVSVVCSNNASTPDHRRRLAFVEALKARLGDRLHLFGTGFRAVEDKWDVIAPYKYHLAVENSSYPDYWTEKAADAFLGGSLLLYWGCPNLADYFPRGSFRMVDRDDPDATASAIESLLKESAYDQAGDAIGKAKLLVLDRYNIFAEVARFVKTLPPGKPRDVSLFDEVHFQQAARQRVKNRVRHLFGRNY
jgi:hypothetical protein